VADFKDADNPSKEIMDRLSTLVATFNTPMLDIGQEQEPTLRRKNILVIMPGALGTVTEVRAG